MEKQSMEKFSEEQLEQALKDLPQWKVEGGSLVREYRFENFVEAMAFVNHAAERAEAAGHHPDIDIRYNRVRIALVTHDAGGITQKDVQMAQQLESSI